MTASCTFGISFTIGAGHDDFINDPSPVTTPTHNVIQYEDGLCPYSDEKEVVVDDGNYADRSVWRTTTTTEDLVAIEDSGSTTTATTTTTTDSRAFHGQQVADNSQSRSGKLDYTRAWHITKSAVKNASSSTSKYLATSAPHQPNEGADDFGLSMISRTEFEKLPLTIQRKVSALYFYFIFAVAWTCCFVSQDCEYLEPCISRHICLLEPHRTLFACVSPACCITSVRIGRMEYAIRVSRVAPSG